MEDLAYSRVRCGISVTGTPKALRADVQEQINLIGREALTNALLHSEATCEAVVEYSPRQLRVMVRDNGRGIDLRWQERDAIRTGACWECASGRKGLGRRSRYGARPGLGRK